jgi:hypothetical protein
MELLNSKSITPLKVENKNIFLAQNVLKFNNSVKKLFFCVTHATSK